MFPSKPDLVILPFKAAVIGSGISLTLEQTLSLLRKRVPVQIARSHPGSDDAIGWTIFRRAPGTYLYENEPLFRFERGARNYIRKVYAVHYSLAGEDDMTQSHLDL